MYQSESEWAEFLNFVSAKFLALKKKKRVLKCPVLNWLIRSLWVSCLEGNVEFLSTSMFKLVPEVARKKQYMPWTAIGYVLENNMEAELHKPASLKAMDSCFRQVVTNTLPEFITDLARLKGVLVAQRTFVFDAKQKMLAGAVSVFLAGAQFAFKAFSKSLEEDGSHE